MGEDTFPYAGIGAALIVGFLGVPLLATLQRLDQKELETGEISTWAVVLLLLLICGTAAAILLPSSPPFLRLTAGIFFGVAGGGIWAFFVIKLAPRVYRAVCSAIWRLTRLWPNR